MWVPIPVSPESNTDTSRILNSIPMMWMEAFSCIKCHQTPWACNTVILLNMLVASRQAELRLNQIHWTWLHHATDCMGSCSSGPIIHCIWRTLAVTSCEQNHGVQKRLAAVNIWLKKFQDYLALGYFGPYLKDIRYGYPSSNHTRNITS